jgi:hypothetical protein
MRLRRREPTMVERFLGPGSVQPHAPRRRIPQPIRIFVAGIRRLVVMTVVAGGICLGIGLLFAHVRGGDRWHDIAVVYYVVGAFAVLAGAGGGGRGMGAARLYGDYSATTDSIRAINEAKARNLVLGVILVGVGVLIDVVSR